MQARKALLKKLASIADWDASKHVALGGDSWLESRNTIYRFRDGVCVAVGSQDPRKNARAEGLVGMRLVGWLAGSAGRSLFTYEWRAGACAVLYRPGEQAEDGIEGGEEAMAMTSATHAFTRGASSANLQALHDRSPPVDSQTFSRKAPSSEGATPPRPHLPSQSSYR